MPACKGGARKNACAAQPAHNDGFVVFARVASRRCRRYIRCCRYRRRIALEAALPHLPTPGTSPFGTPELDWLIPSLMVWAAITIPAVVAGWLGVFPKAGQPRWAALIPFYNIYVLVVKVARLSPLWFVLILIPVVNLIASIMVNVEVAK